MDRAQLREIRLANGRTSHEEEDSPADADEHKGEDGKFDKYFSPDPGAGDLGLIAGDGASAHRNVTDFGLISRWRGEPQRDRKEN